MKFALLIASVSAITLSPDNVVRKPTVTAAVNDKKNMEIAHIIADDQAEAVRHHYGQFTPSGTNW